MKGLQHQIASGETHAGFGYRTEFCLASGILHRLLHRSLVRDFLLAHLGLGPQSAPAYRDPLLSTAKRLFFHWGHVWVVLSINVYCFGKTWALPVLLRL
jgi:hypothetical protein